MLLYDKVQEMVKSSQNDKHTFSNNDFHKFETIDSHQYGESFDE